MKTKRKGARRAELRRHKPAPTPGKTSRKISAKAWKAKCDSLWKSLVKARAGYKCELCGKSDRQMHPHHLISCAAVFFRHNLNNGICLCPTCHNFGFGQQADDGETISAHGTPWAFQKWMEENRPDQCAWWMKNRHEVITGVTINYQEVYEQLKETE